MYQQRPLKKGPARGTPRQESGGAKAGGQAGPGSVTLYARLESGEGETKRDEKGGGCAEELEAEAGESGGAA